jgi:hypothetical protein
MTEAFQILALGMEYAGDLLLCISAALFLGLIAMEDGLK